MARQKLITKAIEKAINNVPYGSTDGQKGDAKVIARFFGGACTFYVLEGYQQNGQNPWDGETVYGLVDFGYGFEYGPFSIKDLEKGYPMNCFGHKLFMPFERDIFVEPLKRTLGECAKMYNEKMPYIAD